MTWRDIISFQAGAASGIFSAAVVPEATNADLWIVFRIVATTAVIMALVRLAFWINRPSGAPPA